MTVPPRPLLSSALLGAGVLALALCASACLADEAAIRVNLAKRLSGFQKIDEISTSAAPGLFELRVGNEIFYTDANGDFLFEGHLIDTKSKVNITAREMERISAIAFEALPLGNSFVSKQGDGTRKLAIFADPNCGYCKKIESELRTLNNITVFTFLTPILGADSVAKSRNIWCSPEIAKAWNEWMTDGRPPRGAPERCGAAVLESNVDFARKHRITGTPTLVFEDGKVIRGGIDGEQIEAALLAVPRRTGVR